MSGQGHYDGEKFPGPRITEGERRKVPAMSQVFFNTV